MKNYAFNLWTHKIKNESIFVGKGKGTDMAGPVDLFLSDTMKEWNNICGAESVAYIVEK